jgi:methylmalonyl-CoA/ethylmalonyl-CoA epimerase
MRKTLYAAAAILMLAISTGVVVMSISSADSSAASKDNPVGFDLSLHHVGISVPDAEASAAWYREMLGFEEVLRMNEKAVNEMFIIHIRRGNAYIELFEVKGADPLPEYRRDPDADLRVHGLKHMAFQVSDVQAAVKELTAKGVEIAKAPIDTPGIAFVFFRDNAGNTFELIQYKR